MPTSTEMERAGLARAPARQRSRHSTRASDWRSSLPSSDTARGETDAAAAGDLPQLVDTPHIRGDLHMHTTYSDGRDALVSMIGGCHALGYEYIAITDHSSGAAASRTLARDDISRQREEIDALRDRFPGMTILHGIEVDILPDGRLDFEDAILERFDIVLASLHEHAGQDAGQLTRRSIAAIRHPLVNVLCHPANQLVGTRAAYALDFDALYAAAAETGTALEIDGAPSHMDLDGDRARAAAAAGATLYHRQRLPSRPGARAPDAFRRRHRPPGVGRAAPRAQYARRWPRCGSSSPPSGVAATRCPCRVGRVVTWLMRLC